MAPPQAPRPRRYLLLDRDGTLIVERRYLKDPEFVELTPGAADTLIEARRLGWGAVVVSNQSGVARGLLTVADVAAVNRRTIAALGEFGAVVDGIYVCPHGPNDGCDCRKPAPGLVSRAAAELGFDPAEAIVVGDKMSDLALGRTIGARVVLTRTGYGPETEQAHPGYADNIIDDLRDLIPILDTMYPTTLQLVYPVAGGQNDRNV